LRSGAQYLGVQLRPFHSLERLARDAEWLASHGDNPPVAYSRLAPGSSDRDRFVRAIITMEQAERIAASLAMLPSVQGGAEKARRWMKKRVERFRLEDENLPVERRQNLHDEPALDALLEIEVAGQLARDPGLAVSFDEPDILVKTSAGERLQVACKRPQSISGIPALIRKAARQIEARADPAVIVVGVDAILHKTDDPVRPTRILVVNRKADATEWLEKQLMEAANAAADEFDGHLKKGTAIAAVLIFGVLFFEVTGYGFRNNIAVKRVTNKAMPKADALTRRIQEAIVLRAPL
jgi:hypothetical protein